jgi:hypothetical protein
MTDPVARMALYALDCMEEAAALAPLESKTPAEKKYLLDQEFRRTIHINC